MQITISIGPDGRIQVQSSLNDQVAIYGLLELAKDAIRSGFQKQANGTGIVAAPAELLSKLPQN